MGTAIVWSIVLRVGQAALQAAPFLLAGVFIAAIFRRFLGPQNTRRLFGGGGWTGLLVGWLIGMLLPVCSLGVIPVVREMRRAGLPGGTILAFALAAPLFNPLSLMYGLTLSEPFTILAFATCSLVVVTVVGALWDWLFPHTAQPAEPLPPVRYGVRRILSLVTAMGRDCADSSAGLILLGLSGVGLLAAVLPPNSLQGSMNHDNLWAPLFMSAIALPAYASPMMAMSQLGMMFQHGNSVGAAFVLLSLGAGMNLGLVAWMFACYGWRRAGAWLALLLLVVLALSYGIDRPLFPHGQEIAGHTHAFDVYCRAWYSGGPELAQLTRDRLRQDAQFFEIKSLQLLGLLCGVGLTLRVVRPWFDVEAWLTQPAPANHQPGRFDVVVSPAVVGGTILLGLVAFSIVGCYAYYPPADETFEEIYVAQGEALSAALALNFEQAHRWIDIYDGWTRKLEVGQFLRRGSLPAYYQARAKLVRDKLELLEHEVQDGHRAEVARLVSEVSKANARLKRAFLEELP
ncbi:MAG: permease [Planctomycetaceae bacterium]|jgi:uncharacterized membrane protein YraQ (UPF0718 family)